MRSQGQHRQGNPTLAVSTGMTMLSYIVSALIIVGLMTFAIFSRHHALQMATEHATGFVFPVGKSESSVHSAADAESSSRNQDAALGLGTKGHFPDAVVKELQEIGAAHAENARDAEILQVKLKDRGNLRNIAGTGNQEKPVLDKQREENDGDKGNLRNVASAGNQEKRVSDKQREENGGFQTAAAKTSDFRKAKLHTVTYATHGGRDDRFCRAVESALRNDYNLILLGWGSKWLGLSQKLKAAHAYAASIPPDDIMLFTDAFDVLFVNSGEPLVQEFNGFNTDIVFSAECGCWPHVMENGGKPCFESYPPSPTPYRYLNSGAWIGRAAAAAEMLLAVMDSAGGDFTNANDQKLVADFYIAGKFGIQLDFYNKMFQSMHMTRDPPLPRCDPIRDTMSKDGKFYNTRTKSQPTVLHFNGGGKVHHLKMEGQAWYKKPPFNSEEEKKKLKTRLISAPTAKDPERKLRFDVICPKYTGLK